MPDYSKGKIYQIECKTTGLVYIGSTCEPTLARRLAKHIGNYKLWQRDASKNKYMTSFEIFKNDNYDIVLLESCPCQSKDELHERETFYQKEKQCVNKNLAKRSSKEYYHDNIEMIKEKEKIYNEKNREYILNRGRNYYHEHKEHLQAISKEYKENNKERLKQVQKEYNEKNREKINQNRKVWYEKNKERLNEKRRKKSDHLI